MQNPKQTARHRLTSLPPRLETPGLLHDLEHEQLFPTKNLNVKYSFHPFRFWILPIQP